MMTPQKLILDVDTGTDDAIALLMAAGLTDFPVHDATDCPLLEQSRQRA